MFQISRYLGDDDADGDLTAKQLKQEKILRKLQLDAIRRKQLRENSKSFEYGSDADDDTTAKQPRREKILKKLQINAIPRKKSRDSSKSFEFGPDADGDITVKQPKQKKILKKVQIDTIPLKQSRDSSTSFGHDGDVLNNVEEDMHVELENEKLLEATSNNVENADCHVDSNANNLQTSDNGFTIIKSVKSSQPKKVVRVLPDWLNKPVTLLADIDTGKIPVDSATVLDEELIIKLKQNGISHLFPVQAQLIPALLSSKGGHYLTGNLGYRPRDICCSAPTGSGKTLAYVLPIVQMLKHRVVRCVRAIVMVPVRDLASQVYKVFLTYCKDTSLKVGLITGQKPFASEQKSLVKQGLRGPQSMVDIIVATPGRLVDHITKTAGFSLNQLRFLIIDEADRMMDEIKQDWLQQLERAVYCETNTSCTSDRHLPTSLTAASCENFGIVLQKLLFSATLSQNPEKLQQLKLFQPVLYTAVDNVKLQNQDSNQTESVVLPDAGRMEHFVGKYTTPTGLKEFYMECSTSEKPLRLLYLIRKKGYKRVLCFTNSLQATHRLYHLLRLVSGCEVRELSSGLHAVRRKKILRHFETGKVDIIVCSDSMARGMDVNNVDFVVSYELPQHFKTYVHRIGRTARAGKPGTAMTLLTRNEIFHYKKMLREAGKTGFKELKVQKSELKALLPEFSKALNELQNVLKDEKRSEQGNSVKIKKSKVKL